MYSLPFSPPAANTSVYRNPTQTFREVYCHGHSHGMNCTSHGKGCAVQWGFPWNALYFPWDIVGLSVRLPIGCILFPWSHGRRKVPLKDPWDHCVSRRAFHGNALYLGMGFHGLPMGRLRCTKSHGTSLEVPWDFPWDFSWDASRIIVAIGSPMGCIVCPIGMRRAGRSTGHPMGLFIAHGTSHGVHYGTHRTSHGLSCSTGCIVLPMRCIELPNGLPMGPVTSDGKAQGRPRGLPMGGDRPHMTFSRDAYLYPRNS